MAKWTQTVSFEGLTWGDLRRMVAIADDCQVADGEPVEYEFVESPYDGSSLPEAFVLPGRS